MKKSTKLAAAVELGRRGGLKGGKARAKKLSAEHRSVIARMAAETRWANRENTPALQAQIKQGYKDYLAGRCRPIEEFMAELEQELKADEISISQKDNNRTQRKRR